jgi:hypothetical protein
MFVVLQKIEMLLKIKDKVFQQQTNKPNENEFYSHQQQQQEQQEQQRPL